MYTLYNVSIQSDPLHLKANNPTLLTWRTNFFVSGDECPSTLVSDLPTTAPTPCFAPLTLSHPTVQVTLFTSTTSITILVVFVWDTRDASNITDTGDTRDIKKTRIPGTDDTKETRDTSDTRSTSDTGDTMDTRKNRIPGIQGYL